MKKSDTKKKGLVRVSDVARAAGVSVPTVHYYMGEGLLTAPVKTSRNMAYYNPVCIDEIKLIKELQTERFLPLSVIKLLLQAKRGGQDVEHIGEMRSLFEEIFRPVEMGTTPKEINFTELVTATGVSKSILRILEESGLLMGVKTEKGRYYDDIDVHIVQVAKKLIELGLKPEDLSVYRKYIEAMRDEVTTIHNRAHELHELRDTKEIHISDLFNATTTLKKYLMTKIGRQQAMEYHT